MCPAIGGQAIPANCLATVAREGANAPPAHFVYTTTKTHHKVPHAVQPKLNHCSKGPRDNWYAAVGWPPSASDASILGASELASGMEL